MAETTAKSTRNGRRVRVLPWRRHRFTDAQYDAMVAAGVLSGTRTFLWAGEIVRPMAEDQPHLGIVSAIFALLIARFARSDWAIHLDQQVTVAPGYRPEPDLSLLRGSARSWSVRGKVPRPGDVALLIEVGDSSYHADSRPKLKKYAEAGVVLYWIVNVVEQRVEVYTNPVPVEGRYATRVDYGPDAVVPLAIPVDGSIVAFEDIPVRAILDGLLPD